MVSASRVEDPDPSRFAKTGQKSRKMYDKFLFAPISKQPDADKSELSNKANVRVNFQGMKGKKDLGEPRSQSVTQNAFVSVNL